jgi:hypothetical protein
MSYGFCPKCGSKSVKRINGNDTCEKEHVFPSKDCVPAMVKFQENRQKGLCAFCGKEPGTFTDELSKKEHAISGLCQECQDAVFKEPEDDSDICIVYEHGSQTHKKKYVFYFLPDFVRCYVNGEMKIEKAVPKGMEPKEFWSLCDTAWRVSIERGLL